MSPSSTPPDSTVRALLTPKRRTQAHPTSSGWSIATTTSSPRQSSVVRSSTALANSRPGLAPSCKRDAFWKPPIAENLGDVAVQQFAVRLPFGDLGAQLFRLGHFGCREVLRHFVFAVRIDGPLLQG